MIRYFYTDPLAAAWMSKHFGMRFGFYDQRSDFREYEVPITGADDEWRSDRGRFYLVPDSLPLLTPQIGDLISHLGVRAWRVDAVDGKTYTHAAFGTERVDRFTFKSDRPMIIQRNGIAFHWPEREEA